MKDLNITFDPMLDAEFLYSIYEDDIEHIMMIFTEFLKNVPGMMKEIDESFEEGDVEIFRQKIHKVKPVFSFVGLTHLTEKAEFLEKKCTEINKIFEVTPLYNELKDQYSDGFPIIENEVKRLEEQVN